MRHHVAQFDAGQPRVVLLQHRQFTCIETKPRHAGVDMHDRRQRTPCVARRGGPRIDFAERTQYRHDVVREIVRFAAGDQPTQHGKHRVRHELPDLQRLVQQCDEEVPAAGGVQRLRDRTRAKSVAIGLDHAGDRTGRVQSHTAAASWRRWQRDRFRAPRRRGQPSDMTRMHAVEVGEAGELGLEEQLDRPGRAVALLGDDQVRLVVRPRSICAATRPAPTGTSPRCRTRRASACAAPGNTRRGR